MFEGARLPHGNVVWQPSLGQGQSAARWYHCQVEQQLAQISAGITGNSAGMRYNPRRERCLPRVIRRACDDFTAASDGLRVPHFAPAYLKVIWCVFTMRSKIHIRARVQAIQIPRAGDHCWSHTGLARRGGIDHGDQCGYDTQGVAGPLHALSMGEGRGGGRGGQPGPMTRGSVESNYGQPTARSAEAHCR
jgi:hypothetical protein